MRLAIGLLFILAGCVSAPPDPTTQEDADLPPMNVVTSGSGMITLSAGGLSATQGGGAVVVEPDARILFVEWAWDDPLVDLDGALGSPSAGTTQDVQNIDHTASGGAPGSPDSPHSLTILAPEPGTWAVSMTANGAATNVEYRFAATVFYAADAVPEGYSAL